MITLARVLLAVVGIFVVLVAGTLVVRSRAARVESADPSPSSADLRIKEVDLEEVTKGVRWRLRAEQALMYEKQGHTLLRNLTVRVFEKDREWMVVGEEGELEQATRRVEIRKNVVITSSDGIRLDTSVIRWDATGKRLWTDQPVTVSRDGSVIHGMGLDMATEEERTTVAGRVRATFVRGSGR